MSAKRQGFEATWLSPENVNTATLGQSKQPSRLISRPTKVHSKMPSRQHNRTVKGLTGKQVIRILTPRRTTNGLISMNVFTKSDLRKEIFTKNFAVKSYTDLG
ncbi:hypothetical protein DY000_02009579 [Brassica cretica]|uniref:Uncharacterized protein n=1 Tax=Brassica cretica TaxID=69181 RepID=A0ABQ7CGA7_BRACR|nr:hypothetical protein DY000_02009579 [Brassica cretica]